MNKVNFTGILLLLLLAQVSLAQNSFFVLNVKGNVKLKKTGASLKANDQITDKDVIIFGSNADAVAVISTKNGRMILKPKPSAKSSELVSVVSEIMSPGTGRLSTRAGKITNLIDLKKYFSEDSLAILGSTKVWISPAAYAMNQENFFFVRYIRNGESINKKLSFGKDSLLISKEEIYKIDGKAISSNEVSDAKLFYKKGAQVTEICDFTILFPDETNAKATVMAYKKNSTLKGDEFLGELMSLLKDVYGRKTDKDNVKSWLGKSAVKY